MTIKGLFDFDLTLVSESGGVTMPTIVTSATEVDVEDGVEVLSAPQEPSLGMTFGSSDAVKIITIHTLGVSDSP
jgi:hypothetical protein